MTTTIPPPSIQPTAFPLTVSKTGNGSGSVSSLPSVINCGPTCSAVVTRGTDVTLTATPASGSTFSGWGGACSGSFTSCTVAVNTAKDVTATFSTATISLGTAVDRSNLDWATGGDAPFTIQTSTSYYGGSAAQTGRIGDNQRTYLSTRVTGPGTLSFYWQVSSKPGYGIFSVKLNGVSKLSRSESSSWSKSQIAIPAGTHTVKWEYSKDSSYATSLKSINDSSDASSQDAGWVDYVVFTPATNSTLYFPHVDTSLPWQTEIAIINTSDQTVTGTLRALSDEGQLVETKAVTLSARGRRQITVADEFTNHTDIGYIIFDTDSAAVQGYTKFYQAGNYRAAIPAVKEVNTSDIYISHIDSERSMVDRGKPGEHNLGNERTDHYLQQRPERALHTQCQRTQGLHDREPVQSTNPSRTFNRR